MGRQVLGDIDGVTLTVAGTPRPWKLGLDALVLSVGGGLGNLARTVRDEFPDAGWENFSPASVTPERPQTLDLGVRHRSGLRTLVLASPHEGGPGGDVSLRSIHIATESAVELCARSRSLRKVGVPIFGTGARALGFTVDEVAPVLLSAVVAAVRRGPPRSVDEVVVLAIDDADAALVASAWGSVSDELAGGISGDLVDPGDVIPLSRDDLGLAPYVSMLATVAVGRATPLPLSIGVFGEWGAGKSFFMGLLRGEIRALSDSGSDLYCRDVVQISFNAWHYVDSNLWASLGDEIFRQLAGPQTPDSERRDELRRQLAQRLEQRRELDTAVDQGRQETARLETELGRATADRVVRARDLVRALSASETFRGRLESVWAGSGVTDQLNQGRLLAQELRGTVDKSRALGELPRTRQGRVVVATAITALTVCVVAAIVAPSVASWTAPGAGVAALLLAGGLGVMRRARGALQTLSAIAVEVQSSIPSDPAVASSVDALRAVETEQRVVQAQLDDVVADIGALGRQIAELAPGRRLYSFLVDRAHGDRYTSNLGLISTIRKDLGELVGLMADWRDKRERGEEAPRPIDRIVLYIDDLDRCAADQVADVLQAVHLLLAFDLFVVVIGVDPRWLARSLTTHYRGLLDENGPGPERSKASTADYLEKVVNIPMVLPAMAPGTLRSLLAGLSDGTEGVGESGRGSVTSGARLSEVPAHLVDLEEGSQILFAGDTVTTPPARPMTERELDVLSALEPLVRTPRRAKRLFNLYRMLRATRDLSEASDFLGDASFAGEHVAVAVLLALISGTPQLATAVLDAPADPARLVRGGLSSRRTEDSWREFLADLAPSTAADGSCANRVVGSFPWDSAEQWRSLHQCLTEVDAMVEMTDLRSMTIWAPRVRRFSFGST